MDAKPTGQSLNASNLFVFLFRWKWHIIGVCFAAAIISSVVSLMIEEKYRSSVTLFATEQHSIGEQFLEDIKRKDLLEYGETEDAERLLQVINSDVIRNRVISQFNLWEVYDINPGDPGANTLISEEYSSNVNAKLTKFGSIQIDVLDPEPERARDIANTITQLTDTVANRMRSDRARQAFAYAKESYEGLQEEIRQLEDSIAHLRELGIYDYLTQIEGLNEQYATAIVEGQPKRAETISNQMAEIAKYGAIYDKLQTLIVSAYEREAIQKRRYELLRIDVNSRMSSFFVVDNASASDKKAYPIRWLIVAMSVAATFVMAVIALLLLESFRNLRSEGAL